MWLLATITGVTQTAERQGAIYRDFTAVGERPSRDLLTRTSSIDDGSTSLDDPVIIGYRRSALEREP